MSSETVNFCISRHTMRRVCFLISGGVFSFFVNSLQAQSLGDVQVISTTPLPGGSVTEQQAPFAVQKAQHIQENAQTQPVNESVFRGVSGAQVNDYQGNPYQADLSYRGFTASPLLGTPQGLSVYVDGIRQNESFGDVVRFDSIPQSALKSVTVLPGTQPQFGLNSLGGAVVMQTKSGRDVKGTSATVEMGDWGRQKIGIEYGQVDPQTQNDLYVNYTNFSEDGWRAYSPSRADQLFVKYGMVSGNTLSHFSMGLVNSSLNGNGVVPRSLYEQDHAQSYTYYDNTRNTNIQLVFDRSLFLDNGGELGWNTYFRTGSVRTFNSDLNGVEDYRFNVVAWQPADAGNPPAGTTCTNNPPLANPNPPGTAAPANLTSDCPGSNNRGHLSQQTLGGGVQYTLPEMGKHQWVVGAQADYGRARFKRSYALGVFNLDRFVVQTQREIEQVNVEADNSNFGVYAQDLIQLSDQTTLLAAGRLNHAKVKTIDRLGAPLIDAQGNQSPGLNNDYSYNRFNPSLGIAHALNVTSTVYGSAGTNNRVPTPVELACSDPTFPCLLPNSMAADPYLKQVITTTFELGYRTHWQHKSVRYQFQTSAFRSNNRDDILFVNTGNSASGGYFTNFGKTRRQGLNLDLSAEGSRWAGEVSYQFLDATYQSSAQLPTEANSSVINNTLDNGLIQVNPGDKIPGISAHSIKLTLAYKPDSKTRWFLDMQAQSSQYARGNENNTHRAGTYNIGGDNYTFDDNGKVPGFAVFNLGLNREVDKQWTLLARVNNLFNRSYFTGGILGANVFQANNQLAGNVNQVRYETFLAPGTPRSIWLGAQYRFN